MVKFQGDWQMSVFKDNICAASVLTLCKKYFGEQRSQDAQTLIDQIQRGYAQYIDHIYQIELV